MNEKIQVVHIAPSLLKSAAYNPRKWDKKAATHLKDSIKQHGFVDPVIVNGAPERENIIIGGHFRVRCAEELGIKTIPAVYINIPDVEKEKELNLRLNRNTGSWDLELLKSFDPGFLLDIGFDHEDLDDVWGDVLGIEDDGVSAKVEAEKSRSIHVEPGDLYELGNHRLICGDSTDPLVVKALMQEEKTSMLHCDPPYNIRLKYDRGVSTKGKYGGSEQDARSEKEYREFIATTLINGLAHTQSDAHIFYWCDQKYIGLIQSIFHEKHVRAKRVCMWIKNNFNMTPQVAFNKAYEPCVYGTIGKPYLNPLQKNIHEVLNKDVAPGNRTIDDIIDLFDIWLAKRDPSIEYEHPTQKPLTLLEKPLRRCTKVNDIILDLFGGSGTTLLACEQMKRQARLVEIDPVFCGVILDRYKRATNTSPQFIRNIYED